MANCRPTTTSASLGAFAIQTCPPPLAISSHPAPPCASFLATLPTIMDTAALTLFPIGLSSPVTSHLTRPHFLSLGRPLLLPRQTLSFWMSSLMLCRFPLDRLSVFCLELLLPHCRVRPQRSRPAPAAVSPAPGSTGPPGGAQGTRPLAPVQPYARVYTRRARAAPPPPPAVGAPPLTKGAVPVTHPRRQRASHGHSCEARLPTACTIHCSPPVTDPEDLP